MIEVIKGSSKFQEHTSPAATIITLGVKDWPGLPAPKQLKGSLVRIVTWSVIRLKDG